MKMWQEKDKLLGYSLIVTYALIIESKSEPKRRIRKS